MIALLLAGVAAAAEPTLVLLPGQAGARPVALRALPDGRAVLVVATPAGRLVRHEGPADALRATGEVAARVDEVGIDARGGVWTRRGAAVARWTADGLVPAALPPCAGCSVVRLREAADVEGGDALWTLPVADGLAVDVAAEAAPAGVLRAPRLRPAPAADRPAVALEVAGADVRTGLEGAVAATLLPGGWVTLAGTRLRWSTAVGEGAGELPDVAPPGGSVALHPAEDGRVVVVARDAARLRATVVDLDAPPLRWVDGWLPAGPPVAWPRPAAPGDPLTPVSTLEVALPVGLDVVDVAVTRRHLVVAGVVRTPEGPRPALALVAR